jgi:hypothetical protein
MINYLWYYWYCLECAICMVWYITIWHGHDKTWYVCLCLSMCVLKWWDEPSRLDATPTSNKMLSNHCMEKKWKKENTRGHKGNHTHTRFITFRVGQQSSDIRCRNAAGCIGVMEMAHWNPLDLIIYIYIYLFTYITTNLIPMRQRAEQSQLSCHTLRNWPNNPKRLWRVQTRMQLITTDLSMY